MARKPKVKVEYDPDANLRDIVILQKTIVEVSEAMTRFNNSRLKRRAVVVLLQDAIGPTKITRSQIEDVLDAAQELGKLYLKPEEKAEQ
jgi:hypothetical protein